MKLTVIVLSFIVLTGCEFQGMSNDEIIAETRKCEAAGLRAQTLVNGWTYKVVKIQCLPQGRAQ